MGKARSEARNERLFAAVTAVACAMPEQEAMLIRVHEVQKMADKA